MNQNPARVSAHPCPIPSAAPQAHNKVQRGTVVTVSVDPGSRHPTISAAALGSTAAEASVPAAPESPRQQSSAPQANKAQHQQAQSQRSGGAAATASASAAPSSSHHNGSSHGGIGDEGGGGEGGGDGADSELPLRNTTVAQTCRMDLTAYLLRRHILSFSRETGRAFFHHMRTNVVRSIACLWGPEPGACRRCVRPAVGS